MKRFVWRLQRVLDIKTKEEQTKKMELLKLTERLARVRSELMNQKRILKGLIDALKGKRPQKRLAEQEFFLKCSVISDELIEKLKDRISELGTQQRKKLAEVLKVRRFKEGLEKLREEAKTEYIRSAERLEQKQADERSTITFVRESERKKEAIIK